MLLDQRRNSILRFLEENGFASLHDLVTCANASESTVRRDLDYLDSMGQIRRTRGGAAFVGENLSEFEVRKTRALTQKQLIGKAIAERIQPGESILLDGGTTTYEVAKNLIHKEIQLVTNSLPIANLLINAAPELLVIGGYLYSKTGVFLGPMAVDALSKIHVRKLIFSSGGVTERGLYNSNSLLVDAERRMLDSAETVILAIDSGKLGHVELAHLCDFDRIDQVYIDDGLTPEWETILQRKVKHVYVVPTK
jgi:DeoR/GlpR family transcriptional regulator of sugar metabolism